MIMDGMDQSKLRSPRIFNKESKLYKSLFRPPLHLTVSWIHSFLAELVVSDPDLRKDSTTQLEILARSLEGLLDTHHCLPGGMAFGRPLEKLKGCKTLNGIWNLMSLKIAVGTKKQGYTLLVKCRSESKIGNFDFSAIFHEFCSLLTVSPRPFQ